MSNKQDKKKQGLDSVDYRYLQMWALKKNGIDDDDLFNLWMAEVFR